MYLLNYQNILHICLKIGANSTFKITVFLLLVCKNCFREMTTVHYGQMHVFAHFPDQQQ